MKMIKAKVLGTAGFTNTKAGKSYRVVYVTYKADGVNGMKCASCFIDGEFPKLGSDVNVIENGRYTNIIENELQSQ